MSSNTCKIPETTGEQPSKEGELKCYECRSEERRVGKECVCQLEYSKITQADD